MKNEENENEWRIKACIVERLQTSVVSNTHTNLGHGCQLLDWNQLSSQCGVAFFVRLFWLTTLEFLKFDLNLNIYH